MTLAIGDRAPDFTLETPGGPFTLSAHEDRAVVLYFYPRDNTPGCTNQAIAFTALAAEFAAANAMVIGVSKDSVASHSKFAAKQGITIPLGSDPDGKVIEAYGSWVEKSLYGRKYMGIDRSTFLIAPEGTIAALWRKVKVAGHAEAVLNAARALLPHVKQ